MSRSLAVLVLSIVMCDTGGAVAEPFDEFLITNIQIVSPVKVFAPHLLDVVVVNRRIASIGDKAASTASSTAVIIEGDGRYLLRL